MKTTKLEWSQEEIGLLQELIPVFNSKKWKNISKVFKQKGYERSETQCREKWVNFFNPKIKNEEWNKEQLEILYQAYQRHKTQWYMIEKLLPGRTQNKIKNRFYGSLRNFIRFIVRFFNKSAKSYSTEINRLSPRYLNMIYESEKAFEFLNGEFPKVLKDLGYLFDRSQFSKKVKGKRDLYFELFQKLIDIFDQNDKQPSQEQNQENYCDSQNQQVEQRYFKQENQQMQPSIFSNYPYMYSPYFFYYPQGSQ